MSELELKRKVLKAIHREFPKAWVWKISDRWYKGIPDLFIIHNGIHIFVELKIPGEGPKKIQENTLRRINDAGGNAYVCDSVENVMRIIKLLSGKGGD